MSNPSKSDRSPTEGSRSNAQRPKSADRSGSADRQPPERQPSRIDELFTELSAEHIPAEPSAVPVSDAVGDGKPSTLEEGVASVSPAASPDVESKRVEPPALDVTSVTPLAYPVAPKSEAAPAPRSGRWLGAQAVQSETEQIIPASSILTQVGWESLRSQHPITYPSQDNQPATLAYARPISGATGAVSEAAITSNAALAERSDLSAAAAVSAATTTDTVVVEILDEQGPRTWSEDELLLVEQVTDQLTLALENARLFEESRTRSEQLAVLNEMSRNISAQLDLQNLAEMVYHYTARLIDATNFYLALNHPETGEMSFILYKEGQSRRAPVRQPLRKGGLTEYIFSTRQPLLIKENVQETVIEKLGLQLYGAPAKSWLGVPMLYGDQVIGALSVQSYTTPGLYTEEDRDLLSAIANQAAVAIQNAHLYAEEQRRRQIADALGNIARAASSTLDVSVISERMLDQLAQLIPFHSATIQLIQDGQRQDVARRLYQDVDADAAQTSSAPLTTLRPVSEDPLIQQVIESRQPLLIPDTHADPRWDILPETKHVRSWVAAPLLVGDQVVGLLIVDHTQPGAYTSTQVEMLSTVTAQVSVATQNARLFEQTQTALGALEVSERYQKSVAQAVATLTERGIAALSDVLQTLGEAARASRAYYLETQVDPRGAYWRLISEWCAPGVSPQISNPILRRISSQTIMPWIEHLRTHGYIAKRVQDLPEESRQFFEPLGTLSLVQFSVAGRHEIPGCIGLEQLDRPRVWAPDEISALQTAASALANTISREDLFTQVQINLAETEALYQASARLNSAASYDDILTVLRQHTILGQTNASSITINLFDRAWTATDKPEWLNSVARWSAKSQPTAALEASTRTSLVEWKAAENLFQPDRPTSIIDVSTDPRLDDDARHLYADQMGARSMLCAPLNVGGRWIGHIIATYRQATGFPEQEVRRLTSLAGQSAVAVQNLQSVEFATQRALEAQKRSAELSVVNRIVSSVAASLDLQASLNIVADELGQILNAQIGIALLDDSGKYLSVVASYIPLFAQVPPTPESTSTGEPASVIGYQIPVQGNLSTEEVLRTRRTLIIDDPQHSPLTATIHELMRIRHISTLMIMPLISADRVIGTIGVDILEEGRKLTPDETRLAETIVLQTSTAIQNARLFRQTQRILSETEALYQASAELNAAQTYDQILEALRTHTMLSQADKVVSITLFDVPMPISADIYPLEKGTSGGAESPTAEWLISIALWTQLPPEQMRPRYALRDYPAAKLLSPNQSTVIEDMLTDERMSGEAAASVRQLYVQNFGARRAIFTPLLVGGAWIGFISGVFSSPGKFEEQDLRRLLALASQAAVAVQNLRLLDESQRRASQLQTAAEIARDTSGTLALESLLLRAVELIRDRFDYYHASVFLLDDTGMSAVVHESTGEAGEEMKRRGHSLPVGGRSIIGQVTLTGQPVVINDVSEAHEGGGVIHRPNPLLPLTRAELGLPLQIGDRVIGALDIQAARTNAFSNEDIPVLQTLADQIAVAVDNARSYELAQQAVEEIREADRLKSQFLANMSHELRTPLNSIIGFSRVILKGIDGPVSDLQQQDLSAIYNSGQHLLGLINDVLDLSKIEAGKMELAFEDNVNLADMIKGVMSTMVGMVKEKPVTLHQIVPPDLPRLRIDSMKVRQILINLLSNAAKFTEKGSITVQVEVQSPGEPESMVMVRVTDTGPGIAEKDQDKLFQAFSQVDGSLTRKTGGSGLGLSICRHLIHMHGGEIGLESEVGKGSTFYFTLPVNPPDVLPISDESVSETAPLGDALSISEPKPVSDAPAPAEATPVSEATPPPAVAAPAVSTSAPIDADAVNAKAPDKAAAGHTEMLASGKPGEEAAELLASSLPSFEETAPAIGSIPEGAIVLVVDKDSQIIDLYRRYLSNYNLTVVALTDLSQAAIVAQGLRPYAITLDVSMRTSATTPTGEAAPYIVDGWQVLKSLKSEPSTKEIPVIICTMLAEQEKGLKMGAAAYLMKPILEDDLVQAVSRLAK